MADPSKHGSAHARVRKAWKAQVESAWQAGLEWPCARCGMPLQPWGPWDLGHVDGTIDQYAGPEHRRCNRQAGAVLGNKQRESGQPLRWKRKPCDACGTSCYGKLCKPCFDQARSRPPRSAPEPQVRVCPCGATHTRRSEFCSSTCQGRIAYRRARGIPDDTPKLRPGNPDGARSRKRLIL